jgi:hypothetical protein
VCDGLSTRQGLQAAMSSRFERGNKSRRLGRDVQKGTRCAFEVSPVFAAVIEAKAFAASRHVDHVGNREAVPTQSLVTTEHILRVLRAKIQQI